MEAYQVILRANGTERTSQHASMHDVALQILSWPSYDYSVECSQDNGVPFGPLDDTGRIFLEAWMHELQGGQQRLSL
jgi:hypothetical protein